MVSDEAYQALQAENAVLRQRVEDVTAQLTRLTEQLANALERIAELESTKTPPPSFMRAHVAERAEPRPPRRQRAPQQNRARRREEPTVVVDHPLTTCPDCGRRDGAPHAAGWCSACARCHEAALDLTGQAFGRGRLGVGIASLVAHLRTALRLPIRAIQRYLADLHGLQVSVGELVALLRRVAERGGPAVTAIREAARRRVVVHADETGWREDGRNGYAWLLATPEGERSVAYHRSRAGQVAHDLLGEAFRGVLVSDFSGGSNDPPGGRHQRCWVHLLRDVRALAAAHADGIGLVDLEVRACLDRCRAHAVGRAPRGAAAPAAVGGAA
jgi:transposase